MRFLKLILFILPFLTITSTISGENFNQKVNDAYSEYIYLVDQETVYGDVALVFGTYKNKYYLSCYLFSYEQDNKIYLRITQQDKLTTYVPDSLIVEGYGEKISENDFEFSFYTLDEEITIANFKFSEAKEKLKANPLKGNGKGNFPKNKKEVSLMSKITIVLLLMGLLTITLAILFIILYRKRVGRFANEMSEANNQIDYIDAIYNVEETDEASFQNYMDQHQHINEDVKLSKAQLVDRLFAEYRAGDITEAELDERLKNLEGEE